MSFVRPLWGWFCLLGLAIVFGGQVHSTLDVFNDTVDEKAHIEAGLEYFQRGVYEYEPQHPPLARAAVAVLPYYVGGLRLTEDRLPGLGPPVRKPIDEKRLLGESFLWAGMWRDASTAEYWRTLKLARYGSLAFGLLAVVVVFLWTRELYGEGAATASAALIAFSPTMLAHAGLATLDAAAAATGTAAAYGVWRWAVSPNLLRAAVAGLLLSVAVCTKFSNVVYLAPVVVAYAGLYRWWWCNRASGAGATLRQAGVAFLVGMLVVLVVYRFDFGSIAPKGSIYVSEQMMDPNGVAVRWSRFLGSTPLLVPALVKGLLDVAAHNDAGHASYLLGEWARVGRILYFPIALSVKTTVPLLLLAIWALGAAFRNRDGVQTIAAPLVPLLFTLAIAMASDINIGVRHILIAYPLMAVVAGGLFRRLAFENYRQQVRSALLLVLLASHVGMSANAHPNYLSYFNALAGDDPGEVLLDSNLDWGQDVARLGAWAKDNGSPCLIVRLFATARPEKFGICTQVLPEEHPDAGLFAISLNFLLGMEGSSPQLRELAESTPLAVVGDTIRIYRITPTQLRMLAPPRFFKNYEQIGEPAR